jgi:hypothetical protein
MSDVIVKATPQVYPVKMFVSQPHVEAEGQNLIALQNGVQVNTRELTEVARTGVFTEGTGVFGLLEDTDKSALTDCFVAADKNMEKQGTPNTPENDTLKNLEKAYGINVNLIVKNPNLKHAIQYFLPIILGGVVAYQNARSAELFLATLIGTAGVIAINSLFLKSDGEKYQNARFRALKVLDFLASKNSSE